MMLFSQREPRHTVDEHERDSWAMIERTNPRI